MIHELEYKKFLKFFSNKTVAVVGNAESLFSTRCGTWIDSHDIVIRFNLGIVAGNKVSHGIKTDWAFVNNLSLIQKHSNLLLETDVNFLELYNHERDYSNFDFNNINNYNLYKLNYDVAQQLIQTYDFPTSKKPSTGLVTLYMLTFANPKHVDVFGFDFKKTITWYNKNRKHKKEIRQNQNDWAKEKHLAETFCSKHNFFLHKIKEDDYGTE